MSSPRDTLIIAPYVAHPIAAADLDNDAWRGCRSIKITRQWSGSEAPAERHAEAQVCWSNAALHVRFVAAQKEPLVIASEPVTDKKTLGLWNRDVCEIFIAPNANNPFRYFEFEVAPTGEWVDLGILVTPGRRETDWNFVSGMTAAARVDAERVTCGMSIPWSESIQRPEAGMEWRVNLFRCVGPDPVTRYLAWQPTRTREPDFHVPEAFGWLRFE
jgi:hypothetical protein